MRILGWANRNRWPTAAVAAYRRRSFLGRHPVAAFLVFGVSPVVSLIALIVASVCMIWLIEVGVGISEQPNPNHLGVVGSAVVNLVGSLLIVVIPTIFATIFYCQLAKWLAIGKKWMVLCSITLAVFASSFAFWHTGPGDNAWLFGLSWYAFICGRSWVALTQLLVNLIVPLAIAWWFIRRKHDQGQLQLAS